MGLGLFLFVSCRCCLLVLGITYGCSVIKDEVVHLLPVPQSPVLTNTIPYSSLSPTKPSDNWTGSLLCYIHDCRNPTAKWLSHTIIFPLQHNFFLSLLFSISIIFICMIFTWVTISSKFALQLCVSPLLQSQQIFHSFHFGDEISPIAFWPIWIGNVCFFWSVCYMAEWKV